MLLVDRHHRHKVPSMEHTKKIKCIGYQDVAMVLHKASFAFETFVFVSLKSNPFFCSTRRSSWSTPNLVQEGVNIFFCRCHIYVPCVPPSFVIYIFCELWEKGKSWTPFLRSIVFKTTLLSLYLSLARNNWKCAIEESKWMALFDILSLWNCNPNVVRVRSKMLCYSLFDS